MKDTLKYIPAQEELNKYLFLGCGLLFVVCVVLTVLSLVSFLLPPNAGNATSLNRFIMFGIGTYLSKLGYTHFKKEVETKNETEKKKE